MDLTRYPLESGKSTASGFWWLFLDSNLYSGNFETELVAYATGHASERSRGADLAEKIHDRLPEPLRNWLDEHVIYLSDEYGLTPLRMVEGPLMSEDFRLDSTPLTAVGISFVVRPPSPIAYHIVVRAKEYCLVEYPDERWPKPPLRIVGFRVIEEQLLAVCHESMVV